MSLKGGKEIGHGWGGVAYYGPEESDPPNSRCKDESIKRGNRVAKVSVTNESDKEWEATEILRNNAEFFSTFAIFPVERCESKEEGKSILFSEYGGVRFKEAYDKLIIASKMFNKYKKYNEYVTEYLKEFFESSDLEFLLRRTIESLEELAKNLDTMNLEYKVWHNDIKDDNIVYRPDGNIKIIDFGFATIGKPDIGNIRDSKELQVIITDLKRRLDQVSGILRKNSDTKVEMANTRRNRRNNMAGGAKIPAVGTKAQVWHGTAKHTSGGLTRKDLMKTKKGRIVSRRKHAAGQKAIKRLAKLGYKPKKGQFKLFTKKSKRGGSMSGFGDMMKNLV